MFVFVFVWSYWAAHTRRHPLIVELKKKASEESKDKSLEDMANLL